VHSVPYFSNEIIKYFTIHVILYLTLQYAMLYEFTGMSEHEAIMLGFNNDLKTV